MAIFVVFNLVRLHNSLTQDIFSHHETKAVIAVETLKTKFDQLINIGLSLADRNDLKKFIAEGKWDDAAQSLKNIQEQFDFIDRSVLLSRDGVLRAVIPELSGATVLIGQDFSNREWYKGISKNWEPYISPIFKRIPEPRLNVIAAAIPIKFNGDVVGIILLPTSIDDIALWAKKVDIQNGYVYFVDQMGQIAGNPEFPEEIADYSSWDIVKKLHQGEQGVSVTTNPEGKEQLISYQPLPNYGWGVIVSQDKSTAFALRNRELLVYAIVSGIFFLYLIILFFIISRLQSNLKQYASGLEQKVAERTREIDEEKSKYAAILESIGDGLVVVDKAGKILMVNKAFENLVGWKGKDVSGKLLVEVVPREDESGNVVPFNERILTKILSTTTTTTWYYIRKDKTRFPAASTITPVIFDGKIIGAVEAFRDITEHEELDIAKTEFISIASHQLRTPVSGLSWITEALQFTSQNLTPKQQTYIKDLSMLSKRLIGLVEDLLNISRIQLKSTLVTEKNLIDVPVFIEEFIKEIEPYASSKKHAVVFNKSIVGPLTVEINKKSLYNVLQNLISNAIEYSPENTAVIVNLEKTDSFIKVSIANKGPIIPKDEQSHIFGRFYRGESAKKMKAEGTGLGLYIVKTIIEDTGGKVGFKSEESKDTTFWFTIPLKMTNEDSASRSNSSVVK
ncbi:MAG: PAS domain S-box protein [Candidatus Yanofskybacteria bacterium]|nr:PAS domain S-box protein [Candidatus Yanofskybacteria bacterium]